MDTTHTSVERDRAREAFFNILQTHMATLQALRLVSAMPDAAVFVGAQLRLKRGMRADPGSLIGEEAQSFVLMAQDEQERGFSTMRGMTLVAICGALEYLIKAAFVDQVAADLDKASALLVTHKIMLNAADVVGLTQSEQGYAIADLLFRKLAADTPSMYRRAVRFLTECAPVPFGEDQKQQTAGALDSAEARLFDEAFLVRNCFVHNGGRVSIHLARVTGQTRGSLIVLDHAYGSRLIRAVRKFGQDVFSDAFLL
jgi:hypothetical protein